MHGFSFDTETAVVAYLLSVLGSILGLLCTSRARLTDGAAKARWLVLAALSIGGTAIWVMHFIAMLGSRIPGTALRYNAGLSILSMVLSISVVAVGLFIVGYTKGNGWILLGGILTGAGVAIMHYVGMAAISVAGTIHYDLTVVAASVLIGLVAATAALWAASNIRGFGAVLGAALIMGVAVSGMHHTGMAAAHVELTGSTAVLTGLTGQELLLPLVIGISFLTVMILGVVILSPSEREMAEERALQARIAQGGRAHGSPRGFMS